MDNPVLTALKTRRSIRSYKAEQITDEELRTVLEAGTWAPTGKVTAGLSGKRVLRCQLHRNHKFDKQIGPYGRRRGDYEKEVTSILRTNGHRVLLGSEESPPSEMIILLTEAGII